MLKVLLKFFTRLPTATLLYVLLLLFAKLNFSLSWFMFAITIDIIDWVIGEIT